MSIAMQMSGPGGSSIAIGPSERSRIRGAYGVSELRVKPTCFGWVSSVPKNLVGNDSDLRVAFEDGRAGHGWIEETVGLNGADEVGVVLGLLRGFGGGEAALEGV
jgi:hypothetical protein